MGGGCLSWKMNLKSKQNEAVHKFKTAICTSYLIWLTNSKRADVVSIVKMICTPWGKHRPLAIISKLTIILGSHWWLSAGSIVCSSTSNWELISWWSEKNLCQVVEVLIPEYKLWQPMACTMCTWFLEWWASCGVSTIFQQQGLEIHQVHFAMAVSNLKIFPT